MRPAAPLFKDALHLLCLQLPEWDPASTAVLFPEGPDTPAVGDPACPPFQQLVVLGE